jgi:hypothetical protein
MPHYLPSTHSFCECGGAMLVLDMRQDRYFQLGRPASEALRAFVSGSSAPQDGIAALCRLGVISDDRAAGGSIAPTAIDVPVRSVIEETTIRSGRRWTHYPEISGRLIQARAALRLKGFARTLDTIRVAKAQALRRADLVDEVRDLAIAFDRGRRAVPLATACLPDSLALYGFLARRGIHSTLVIGVKTNPFAAHCWIQHEGLLLNEAVDHAAAFTPIRVL